MIASLFLYHFNYSPISLDIPRSTFYDALLYLQYTQQSYQYQPVGCRGVLLRRLELAILRRKALKYVQKIVFLLRLPVLAIDL